MADPFNIIAPAAEALARDLARVMERHINGKDYGYQIGHLALGITLGKLMSYASPADRDRMAALMVEQMPEWRALADDLALSRLRGGTNA